MHGLAVYVKKGLLFAWDLSLESLFMCSTGFTPFSLLLLFLYQSRFLSLFMVFDTVSSNIYEVLSISIHLPIFCLWRL